MGDVMSNVRCLKGSAGLAAAEVAITKMAAAIA